MVQQPKNTAVQPFLPNLVLHKLGPPSTPKEERFEAAVLFADIIGFTTLTERMVEKGPFGAEQLHKALSALLGDLIEIITDHGGEVIKFAGDAILAAWVAPTDEEVSFAVRRACAAALEIQSTHRKTDKADDRELRVGVAAGPVWLASIGGVEQRWEILLAGSAVEQLGPATSLCQPGDVILSPEAWALVQQHAAGRELTPNGCVGLDTVSPAVPQRHVVTYPSVDPEVFLPYIPRALQARLAVGQEKLLPEFRQASVMFVNLPGMDFESAGILGQVHEAVRVIQTVVYRFGGSVNQLIADDKGTLAIAAWGLALHTYEDDAIRSVRAGLILHRELVQLGYRADIGISTGTVFTGMRGNARRADYALIGAAVNLAARLMQHGESTVLVDNATRIAARDQIVFEVLPKAYLKGVSSRLSLYRPVRKKTKAAPGAELIGRDEALELLLREMTTLRQSRRCHTVLIQGEPGIGKSRLVGALLDRSQRSAVRSFVCWGDPIEQTTGYFPWRQVFFSLLEEFQTSYESTGSPNLLPAVQKLLATAPHLQMYVSLLAPIFSLDVPENDETKALSPEGRSEKCRALLCHLFSEAVGTLPTLLVLEDVHWFDQASWSLTHALRGLKNPTLIVLTTRVVPRSEAGPVLIALQNEKDVKKIELSPLDQQSMLALAGARLGVDSLSSSFMSFLSERTDGNPFLIEQLCLSMKETGLIRLEQGECQVVDETALGESSVPQTVKSLISSRIDRLSPREQLAIKVASVIGRNFDFDLLAKMMPEASTPDELSAHLLVMGEMELVKKKEGAGRQFTFKHAMTCETAYDLLTLAQKKELHQAAAEAIDESRKGDPAQVCSVLAFHYTRAGKTDSAIKWLTMAGDQAFANFANREAARFYEQALELSSHVETIVPAAPHQGQCIDPVAHLNLSLGQAKINARSYVLGANALEHGVVCLGLPIPKSPLRAGFAAFGQLVRQIFHRLMPAYFIGARKKDRERLLRAASAYEGLGEAYYFTQRPIECFTSVIRGLNLAEVAGPSSVLARGYASLGATLGLTPLYKAAENHFKRAFDTATELNDPGTTTWVTLVYGIHRIGMGDWEIAEGLFQQVVELSEQTGDRRRKLDGTSNLAYLAYLRGNLVSAQHLAAQILDSVSVTADNTSLEGARRVLIYCNSAMGEFGAARTQLELLKELIEAGHAGDELASKIDYYSFSALIYAHERQFERALEAANAALCICLQNTSAIGFYTSIVSCEAMTEALLTMWEQSPDLSEIAKMAKKSTAIAIKLAKTYPIGLPKALMLKGTYLWLQGRRKRAMEIWERSLETAVRMNMPVHAALAELELVRHKPHETQGRKPDLDRLHRTFEQLGTHLYAKRTLQEMLTLKR